MRFLRIVKDILKRLPYLGWKHPLSGRVAAAGRRGPWRGREGGSREYRLQVGFFAGKNISASRHRRPFGGPPARRRRVLEPENIELIQKEPALQSALSHRN